ncbi:DUF6680 family protein [Sphingomonas sp. RS2018]
MTNFEVITLIAILVGPIFAVLVQIFAERRKNTKDQRTTTFRMMVSVRHLPADPAYSTAINMIPIDFNGVPAVMAAHRTYIDAIRYQVSAENVQVHLNQVMANQTKLIFEMAKHLGYRLPETEIQTTAYAAQGFIERDNLMLDGWRAWQRIAAALESQSPQSPEAER